MLVAAGIVIAGLAQTALPSMAASPAPVSSPSPLPYASNLCTLTPLFSWPANFSMPTVANVQRVRFGERFEIRSGPRRTLDGRGFYETTIPVAAGSGTGAYYWVSDWCFHP